MSQTDEETPRTVARQKIIETAQLNCYEVRSQCIRFKSEFGTVPRGHLLAFQDAILDYYWALRPMREAPAVREWWKDVELSKEWKPDGDGPASGLDAVDEIDESEDTVQERRYTVRGWEVDEHTQQQVLSFKTLKDISGVLDEAASKLGFTPTTPTPVETDPDPV